MRRRTLLTAGLAVAASATITSTSAAAADEVSPQRSAGPDFVALLDAVVTAGAVSAIAEVREDTHVWRGGSGSAELGGHRAAPVAGRYRAGSVTKTLVATVVLQLADEGRLRLSDSVEHWLPGLVPGGRRITVRHLLQHMSGLFDYTSDLLPEPSAVLAIRSRTFQPVELVRIAVAHPPYFEPGTNQNYSNTDYILLGMIIDRAAGRSWRTEAERRILRPLGLRDTELPGASPRIAGPHAHVYIAAPDGVPVDVTTMNPTMAGAAGELISTTADLNRFFDTLLTPGCLLPTATLADMTDPRDTGFGLGLEVADLPTGRVFGHGGGGPGFLGLSFITADRARQITLTSAVWGGEPHAAAAAMLMAALGGCLI
ncbi:serine hydrolase domain-containing protein [Catenulispora subtropica]|uniref:Serine hydrolase domain-containing protein n=1 Tax=Catenulispora subtropica TaxID=450798 RepID=A0ABN2QQT3_9ACTN